MSEHYLVLGGAGFIGSHVVERLVRDGQRVTVVDNLLTGSRRNLAASPAAGYIAADVTAPGWAALLPSAPTRILHLASPASPVAYTEHPLATLLANSEGTRAAAALAEATGARLVFASTSEVYGDPEVHPQQEEYRGNVSTIGPRAMYDEGKRYGEALLSVYRTAGVNAGIVRIFNTYGPRMDPYDGRVVPTFLRQATDGDLLTVTGDGSQTRSLCYVSDLVDGLLRMLGVDAFGPVNLGNPGEVTMTALAERVLALPGCKAAGISYVPLPEDDPRRRRPNIDVAGSLLGWSPTVGLDDGLNRTWGWWLEHR